MQVFIYGKNSSTSQIASCKKYWADALKLFCASNNLLIKDAKDNPFGEINYMVCDSTSLDSYFDSYDEYVNSALFDKDSAFKKAAMVALLAIKNELVLMDFLGFSDDTKIDANADIKMHSEEKTDVAPWLTSSSLRLTYPSFYFPLMIAQHIIDNESFKDVDGTIREKGSGFYMSKHLLTDLVYLFSKIDFRGKAKKIKIDKEPFRFRATSAGTLLEAAYYINVKNQDAVMYRSTTKLEVISKT